VRHKNTFAREPHEDAFRRLVSSPPISSRQLAASNKKRDHKGEQENMLDIPRCGRAVSKPAAMDLRTTEVRDHGNVQQSGGSMPLFTVTMKSNRSTNEKDRLSRSIHAASIAAGYPEDDLFQRFLSLGPSDLRDRPQSEKRSCCRPGREAW
jgi:hypothetical protein